MTEAPIRVLVADDQPDVRRVLKLLLAREGFEVASKRTTPDLPRPGAWNSFTRAASDAAPPTPRHRDYDQGRDLRGCRLRSGIMPGIHSLEITVPAEAIDANGHVNNLEYLRWMQDIAVAHSAERGWDMARYLAVGGTWVVRAHTIEYLGAAYEGDVLALHTWVGDLGKSSSRRRYLVWRAADACLIARAETLWVYVDMRTGRARRIPEELRASFTVLPSTEAVMEQLELVPGRDGRAKARPH